MPTEVSLSEYIHRLRQMPYGVLMCSSGFDPALFPTDYETFSWLGGLANVAQINQWPEQGKLQLGFLSYDLKNELHGLSNSFSSDLDWPQMGWFLPEFISQGIEKIELNQLFNNSTKRDWKSGNNPIFYPKILKQDYLKKVETVRELIRRGTVYELNLCQAFQAHDVPNDPIELFFHLRALKPVSFSVLVKWEHRWLLCFSPERFLRKNGSTLTSQPIKGTIARGKDPDEDYHAAVKLKESKKDQAENVMIVDLVRNDFARICESGTVEVPSLMNVYSFPTVHQMISTVTGQLKQEQSFQSIISSCFPMGSMTGAPKREAMIQIDQIEGFSRNIFSGSVGYLTPEGDFDFNVLIRSLYINEKNSLTTCFSGGAITYQSIAEEEYDESILKAEPLIELAGGMLVRS